MDMIVKSESLTSVADAIRTKGETTEQLVFPADFVTAIHAIQSGGVSPQLIVTAPAGSTITAVNGEDTVTGAVGAEGTLTLDLPAFGTWMVTAALDGREASASIRIEQEYPIELQYGVTFNISGGHDETVTAYVDDVDIGSVQLDPTGEGSVFLEGVNGKTVKFVGGLSGYEKTIIVGDEKEISVKVYPDGALFWHGRQFVEKTGGWTTAEYTYGGRENTNAVIGSELTILAAKSATTFSGIGTLNKVNFSGYSNVCVEFTAVEDSANFHITSGKDIYTSSLSQLKMTNTGQSILPVDETETGYATVFAVGNTTIKRSGTVSKVWCE